MSLLDLPCEDVVCFKIFPNLSFTQLTRLKLVSKTMKDIVDLYNKKYVTALSLDLIHNTNKEKLDAFWKVSENCRKIKLLSFSCKKAHRYDYGCDDFVVEDVTLQHIIEKIL